MGKLIKRQVIDEEFGNYAKHYDEDFIGITYGSDYGEQEIILSIKDLKNIIKENNKLKKSSRSANNKSEVKKSG